MLVNIIDTHCHLNDEYFKDKKEAIIASFPLNNIDKVFVVGYDLQSSIDAINLANNYKNVYAIIGIHPENCDEYNDNFEKFIIENSKNKKVVAIGEIGLDYHYTKENKEKQKDVFIKQIKLANTLHLPITIHSRDSIGDLIEILTNNKSYLTYGGVIHCFNESVESYRLLKNLNFKFSFGGSITFKNSKNAQNLLENVSLEDIMLETDSPYLTPEPLRGREKNEPKNVWLVLDKISKIKNIDKERLAIITNNNVYSVFKRVQL